MLDVTDMFYSTHFCYEKKISWYPIRVINFIIVLLYSYSIVQYVHVHKRTRGRGLFTVLPI